MKHRGNFFCLNCLDSFPTENKRESHKKVCENKDFCNVIMPSRDNKILVFNQELAEKFAKQFTCLSENTEKYITFSVPIQEKVKRIDKNEEEITKTISFRLQFIDSARYMVSSPSDLVNTLAKGIHKIKCKYGHYNKKCETCRIKYKDRDCFFKYINFKDDLIE